MLSIADRQTDTTQQGDLATSATRAGDYRGQSVGTGSNINGTSARAPQSAQGIAADAPKAGPMLRSVHAGANTQGGIAGGWQRVPADQLQGMQQGIGAPIDATKARADYMGMDRQTSQATAALPATRPGIVPGRPELFTDHNGNTGIGYRHGYYETGYRPTIDGQTMAAANAAARDPARKSIAYTDAFNKDAASRGMDVQKVVDPKTGAVTYTGGNPYMGQQFQNHGIAGIAGPLSGHQIRQAQGEIDTANAQAAERGQISLEARTKLDAIQAKMGLDDARAAKAEADAAHVGEPRRPTITLPQQAKNAMIDRAREKLTGMSSKDVLARTQQYTSTGRENPDFDPELARAYRLANTRKIGDDPTFDVFTSGQGQQQAGGQGDDLAARFTADNTMNGYRLGKATDLGAEVLDEAGNLVGHYR